MVLLWGKAERNKTHQVLIQAAHKENHRRISKTPGEGQRYSAGIGVRAQMTGWIQRPAAWLRAATGIPGARAVEGSGLTYCGLHDSALDRGLVPARLRCPLSPPRRARRPGAGPASLESRRHLRPACKGKRDGVSAAVPGSPIVPARTPRSRGLTRRLQQLQAAAQQRCRHGGVALPPARPGPTAPPAARRAPVRTPCLCRGRRPPTHGRGRELKQRNCHLKTRQNFAAFKVPKRWNRLPRQVLESPSLEIFKIMWTCSCVICSR